MTGHDLPLHISGRRWKDGFREKCVATLRYSSYKGGTYFSPDVWKALAFPPLSLSLFEDPPYLRDVSRCQGARIYRRERTSRRCAAAAHSYLLLFCNSFQASIPPRKSTPAEIYERVETLVVYKNGARDREICYPSLSLSLYFFPFHS